MPKAKKGQTILPCGCTCTVSAWEKLCETHRSEFNGTHARWRAEKLANALADVDVPAITLPEVAK